MEGGGHRKVFLQCFEDISNLFAESIGEGHGYRDVVGLDNSAGSCIVGIFSLFSSQFFQDPDFIAIDLLAGRNRRDYARDLGGNRFDAHAQTMPRLVFDISGHIPSHQGESHGIELDRITESEFAEGIQASFPFPIEIQESDFPIHARRRALDGPAIVPDGRHMLLEELHGIQDALHRYLMFGARLHHFFVFDGLIDFLAGKKRFPAVIGNWISICIQYQKRIHDLIPSVRIYGRPFQSYLMKGLWIPCSDGSFVRETFMSAAFLIIERPPYELKGQHIELYFPRRIGIEDSPMCRC